MWSIAVLSVPHYPHCALADVYTAGLHAVCLLTMQLCKA